MKFLVVPGNATMPKRAMHVLREPADAALISNPHVRALIELRIQQLGTFDDCELVIVEPGDSAEAVAGETGCAILFDPFSETHFGSEEFSLNAEVIEDHGHVYTLLFATSDTHAVEIVVPKVGSDANLLAYCSHYAVPATAIDES